MRPLHAPRVLSALAVAAAGLLALTPTRAHAQDRVVGQLLNTAAHYMRLSGYVHRDTFNGALNDGTYESLTVTLRAGVTYSLLGVCDGDCDDLDFRLFDDDGNEVARDVSPDDTPLVRITPTRTQEYHLHVIMASCAADPCSYGVGLYASN